MKHWKSSAASPRMPSERCGARLSPAPDVSAPCSGATKSQSEPPAIATIAELVPSRSCLVEVAAPTRATLATGICPPHPLTEGAKGSLAQQGSLQERWRGETVVPKHVWGLKCGWHPFRTECSSLTQVGNFWGNLSTLQANPS